MKRSERLRAVQRVMQDEQRQAQLRAERTQRQVAAAAERLQELLRYREEYILRYRQDAGDGISAARLRNYQTFLDKLDQALRQQQDLLARARAEAEFEAGKLRDISGQVVAVGGVADRWSHDEQRQEERREQGRSDEHGARQHAAGRGGSGQ